MRARSASTVLPAHPGQGGVELVVGRHDPLGLPEATALCPSCQMARSRAIPPGDADRAASLAICTSSSSRTSSSSSTSWSVGTWTKAPWFGRRLLHPAFRLEAVQRLADRLAAHPELAGQLGLDQVLTGAEPAAHHQLDQGLVHGLAQRHRPRDRVDERGRAARPGVRGHDALRMAFSISAAVSKMLSVPASAWLWPPGGRAGRHGPWCCMSAEPSCRSGKSVPCGSTAECSARIPWQVPIRWRTVAGWCPGWLTCTPTPEPRNPATRSTSQCCAGTSRSTPPRASC